MTIKLSDAQRVIAEILKRAEGNPRKAVIAVCDSHGDLIAFARMDNAPLTSVTLAINKAYTAARAARTSEEFGKKVNDPANLTPISSFGDPRLTGMGGGIPIYSGISIIGAIGISGLIESEDIELAEWGASELTPK